MAEKQLIWFNGFLIMGTNIRVPIPKREKTIQSSVLSNLIHAILLSVRLKLFSLYRCGSQDTSMVKSLMPCFKHCLMAYTMFFSLSLTQLQKSQFLQPKLF